MLLKASNGLAPLIRITIDVMINVTISAITGAATA